MALNFEQTWSWIFLIPVACMSFCWYLVSIYWFWWMFRFPAAFSYSILRSLGVRFQALQKKDEDRFSALGKTHVTYEDYKPLVNVRDPEIIKGMLVPRSNTFGDGKIQKKKIKTGHCAADNMASSFIQENWKSIRETISLAFTPGKFRRCAHIMERCCQELCQQLLSKTKKTEFIDMKRVFDEFCIKMTFCTMFDVNNKASEDNEKASVVQALELLKTNLKKNPSFSPKDTGPNLTSFIGTTSMCNTDMSKFQEFVSQIIAKRMENKQVKTDFLQLLMESFFPEKNVNEFHEGKLLRKKLHNAFTQEKAKLSSDLIAHCLLFFAEGYRMTSSVLSLVVYNLALNPYHQERLRKEVTEVLLFEKSIDFNSISKMTYLDQIVCETLRLYPPVSRLQRFAAEDYSSEEAELIIRKGTEISIPLCPIHRNSGHFPNPEKFDPERFAPKQWSKRHPYTFIPFGVGARNCIGMKLALTEIKLCLVYLIKHLRFVKAAKTKIPVEFHENHTLIELKELQLHVEEVTV